MRISKLSPKQRLAMNWWNNEQYRSYDAVICDGAVRSGKTLALSLGFVLWAAASFDKAAFAMCGKTVTALRRNVIAPLMPLLRDMGIQCSEKVSRSYFDVSLAGRSNRFYLFGGRDEGSAALIQGMTLSGVFFDEVLGKRIENVVLLQSGKPRPLVLQRVDKKGGGEKRPVPPLHHGRQPLPFREGEEPL